MPQTPLLHRILRRSGYGLAALFVLAAAAVLVWPLLPDGAQPSARPTTGAQSPGPGEQTGEAPGGVNPFEVLDPAQTGQPAPGAIGACGAQAAHYERKGDGIEVSVVYTGIGTVRAIVQPVTGEPMVQSYSTAQDPNPHVFRFDAVTPQAIKKVSLTVTSAAGMNDCDVPRK